MASAPNTQPTQAAPKLLPRNHPRARSLHTTAAMFTVFGVLFALSWPIAHFIIFPILAALFTVILYALAILTIFLLFIVADTNNIYQSALDYLNANTHLTIIILTFIGIVMLVIAGIKFSQYSKTVSKAVPVTQIPATPATQPSAAPNPTQTTSAPQFYIDFGSVGYYFLSFFVPIVGLILWICWHSRRPISSQQCKLGLLIFCAAPFFFMTLLCTEIGNVPEAITGLIFFIAFAIPLALGYRKITQSKNTAFAQYDQLMSQPQSQN